MLLFKSLTMREFKFHAYMRKYSCFFNLVRCSLLAISFSFLVESCDNDDVVPGMPADEYVHFSFCTAQESQAGKEGAGRQLFNWEEDLLGKQIGRAHV